MLEYNGKKLEITINFLLELINEQNLKDGHQLPSENDLSKEIGVSRVTVRRALATLRKNEVIYSIQGSGNFVGKDPEKAQIQNSLPRIIPLVVSHGERSTRGLEIIQGAEDYLSQNNCKLTVHITDGDDLKEREVVTALYDEGIKCMIVMPHFCDQNADVYFDLIRKGVDIVFIDKKPNINCNYIASDNFTGGYLATKHLLDFGHKKIAVLSRETPQQASTLEQRVYGYHCALREYNIMRRSDLELFMPAEGDPQGRVDQLLSIPDPPTAIFALNDQDAIMVLNHLHRKNIVVPDEISIMGFDNISMTAHTFPTVSTIDQSFYRLGYKSAEMALNLIKKPHDDFFSVSLPVTLIERESTASLKEKAEARNSLEKVGAGMV